jgi:flagellar M-ring protein FliF
LAKQHVVAINHLVASAVEGLSPDAVSVLDMNGNLLGRPRANGPLDGPEASEAGLDYRRKIEADLLSKVNSTLEPLLGANKFRANVSVECDFTGAEQSEEIFDPTRSVMLSSQRTEDVTGGAASNGVPGTASTLPRPTSRPGSSAKGVSRMTENITYQTSRTVKKTRLPAGTVRKMSLAVLLDQDVTWTPDKGGFTRVLAPPSAEKIKVLRELVSGITGFNAERGDQLVVESLPFETTLLLEPPAAPTAAPPPSAAPVRFGLPTLKLDRRTLLIAGGAVAGLLLLGVVAMRLKRRKKRQPVEVGSPAELAPPGGVPATQAAATQKSNLEEQLAERAALEKKLEAQALSSLKLAPVITKTAEVLAKHLREKITKDPEVSAQVLRTWIREEEV